MVFVCKRWACADIGFGKPDQGGLLLPTDVHVTSNEGNEAIVVDSWEDCDAEITAPST